MSGKKQHHIPQSLQRGFLFDVKAEKTYVHRRDGRHFPASISDVLAQRYFYSRQSSDGSVTLDDRITVYEDRLGRLLSRLRDIPINGGVDAALAAEVIAHLTPRTANMRRIFGSGMGQLMTAVAEAFADDDTVMTMLGLAEPEPNPVWNDHIARVFEEEPNLKMLFDRVPIERSLLDRIAFMAVKEHFVGSFDINSLGVTEVCTSILDRLDDEVRKAHNNALGQSLVADARMESLEKLKWRIQAAPPEGAILPDCVAIGTDDEVAGFLPYMMTKTASVCIVIMPLTSDKLLVGIRSGLATPNLGTFNHDAAACSDELFITASNAPIFDELRNDMGARWVGEIDALIQDALKEVLPSKNSLCSSSGKQAPLSPFTYQLTFSGLGNTEEEVAKYSETVQRVVNALHIGFNLELLDGFTFTTSFQATLEELDRGFDINTSPERMPDYIAEGAATALVLRDGVPKIRIILNAKYGVLLVGEETRDAEVALHLIVAGVAQVDTLSRMEKALPGFLLEPILTGDHGGILHCAVRKALRAYRYALDSADFGADDLFEQEFSKYLKATVDAAYANISKAKEEHAERSDFPKLFEITHGAAMDILISAARLIGHRHGMGKFELSEADASVVSALSARQLSSWAEVFSRDLQRFWQKETWTRADFYGLNIHAERVLWASGILLWRDPNSEETMIMAAPPPRQTGEHLAQ